MRATTGCFMRTLHSNLSVFFFGIELFKRSWLCGTLRVLTLHMVAQMPTFKTDPNMTLTDLKALLTEDIKRARENNNTQDNCGHLTRYVIELIKYYYNLSTIKPSTPSTAASNNASTSAMLTYNNQGGVIASSAQRAASGLNAILPEPPRITADLTDASNLQVTYDLSNPPQALEKIPVSNKDLSQQLKNHAALQGQIIFGEIALVSKYANSPGHVLAFITDSKDIVYIDAQLYNGHEKKGVPCFETIETQYAFERHIQNQVTFQSNCFYLVYGTLNHPIAAAAEIHIKAEAPAAAVAAPAAPAENNNHGTDIFMRFPPTMMPHDIWDYLQRSHDNKIINLTPDLSIEHIGSLSALKEFKMVLLHCALSQDQAAAAVTALEPGVRILIDGYMPINSVVDVARALKPGGILCLPPNISEGDIQDITAVLKEGTVISWSLMMEQPKIQLLSSSLKPGCSIFVPTQSEIERVRVTVAALPAACGTLSIPAHSLNTIQAMASSLQKDRIFLLHRSMSHEQLQTAASALQPGCVLSIPGPRRGELMPIDELLSAVTYLREGARILLHPDIPTLHIRYAVSNLKSGRILCLQAAMGRKKLRAAAEDLSAGAGVLLYPELNIVQIKDITGSLKQGFDVFLHPAMPIPNIQAAAATLKPDSRLCLSPDMSVDQLQAISELKIDRAVLLHQNLSEEQIKVITSSLQLGTRVLLHPEMAIEHIPNAVAAVKPGCVLLLDQKMEIPKIQATASGLNLGGLLELDPHMLLEDKLRAAASALQPGRVLSLNPLPSKEKITLLIDNLAPGVSLMLKKSCAIQDFLNVRDIILSRKGANSGINILMEGHNPNEALTLSPPADPRQPNHKRTHEHAFFGAEHARGEEKESDNPRPNPGGSSLN